VERARAQAAAIRAAREKTAAERLAVTDELRKEGHIALAVRRYRLLMAIRNSSDDVSQIAKQRLDELTLEGETKLSELEERLDGYNPSTGESAELAEQEIVDLFAEFEKLTRDYQNLPQFGDKIVHRLSVRRSQARFAAVLQEPEAKQIFDLALQHEESDKTCCAFQFYEQAARLAPAKSGLAAATRIEELKRDPDMVAAAEKCQKLQWCHSTYNRAERLAKVKPQMAQALFNEIVSVAPHDSEIFQAAKQRVEELLESAKKG